MTILQRIFSDPQLKPYYLKADELKAIRNEFEHYIYSVYEKSKIIAEIKNKYYDIKYKDKGYIDQDIKNKTRRKKLINQDKLYIVYKKWTNTKLKRLIKIFNLEIESKYSVIRQDRDIVRCIKDLRTYFRDKGADESIEPLYDMHDDLKKLEGYVKNQLHELKKVYPLKDWSEESHEKIISEKFLMNFREEIRILFNLSNLKDNYNYYPALISEAIHLHKIPKETTLKRLIDDTIQDIKKNRPTKNMRKRVCYHARPVNVTKPLFPIGRKSSGFFVDTNLNETISFVQKFYNLQSPHEVEVFELKIPENLFKHAMDDRFDPEPLKVSLDHSYTFRPSIIPKINEYFKKGLIVTKKLH